MAKALLERGDTVVSFDRRRRSERPSAIGMLGIEDDLVQVEADLTDGQEVGSVLDEHGVDSVFHLAAETIVGTVAASPAQGFESNVRGTWTVLEACRERDLQRVVFASSDKAYGAHDTLPYREDFALQPTAPYEASKAAADLIARSYWHSYGLPVAVTRFANIYGGGDLNFSRLIPEAVSAAVSGRPPVLRSDGSPERDFLYVEDAAAAYLAIADALDRDDVRGEAFNAGGGRVAPRWRRRGDDRRALRTPVSSPRFAAREIPPARSIASTWTRRSCARRSAGSRRGSRGGPAAHDRLVPRPPRVARSAH